MAFQLLLIPLLLLSQLQDAATELESEIERLEERLAFTEEKITYYDSQINATDTRVSTHYDMMRDAKAEYQEAQLAEDIDLFYHLEKVFSDAKKLYEKILNESLDLYDQRQVYTENYDAINDKLSTTKNALNQVLNNIEAKKNVGMSDVSILLSQGCERLIKYDMPTKCPTYAELREQFDNTFPHVSGKFEFVDNDLRRETIKVQNHWKYYEQYDNWIIVMVDPDTSFAKRSVNVVVQPREFESTALYGHTNINSYSNNTITTWKNIKISDNCKTIVVAPDMRLIAEAVNHAMYRCTTELDVVPFERDIVREIQERVLTYWQQYEDWLEKNYEKIRQYRIGLD